ncbi:L-sorbose 1-dehydrogenase [Ceratobasidium sp. AG-Ba]|nr:L-sorbose 1-dehydrogenase [Ceratobasidium sp. AG-Ba]QRW07217.1 L-sorbose 1-dehydrogenase [Ceratobasidium sp. AG-Ba]
MPSSLKPSLRRIKAVFRNPPRDSPPAPGANDRLSPENKTATIRTSRSSDTSPGLNAPGLDIVTTTNRQTLSKQPAEAHDERKGWDELYLLSRLLSKFSSPLGPLKQAIDGILDCIDIIEGTAESSLEYQALKVELNALFQDLCGYFGGSTPPMMTPCIVNLSQEIEKEIKFIQEKESRGRIDRYMQSRPDIDELMKCYRRIQGHLGRLMLNVNLNIWKVLDEQITENRLKHLPNSAAAKYRSTESSSLGRDPCLPNTRLSVLNDLYNWAENNGGRKIYWLNGMAGTGKTTIAFSFCQHLEKTQQLAASFFCSRQLPECRNVNRIIPTIAYQLSLFSRPFRYVISRILERDLDVHNQSLSDQFKQLIAEPLNEIRDTLPGNVIVVIDALDECDSNESVDQILGVLLSNTHGLPLKFFLASRPDAKILDRMRAQEDERIPTELRLHELEHSIVQDDIRIYLSAKLHSRIKIPVKSFETIVQRSGVLFIYAATAVRYISSDNFSRSSKRLAEVLSMSDATSRASTRELDALYGTILGAAFNEPSLAESDQDEMKLVMHTVLCALEPLSVNVITGLLGLEDHTLVHAALRPLYSVLKISGDAQTITTLLYGTMTYCFLAVERD